MQVEAIMRASVAVAKAGVKVFPEIMIPLVGTYQELEILRKNAIEVAEAGHRKRERRSSTKSVR
jgi:pyruvate,orthophosphate dikinase